MGLLAWIRVHHLTSFATKLDLPQTAHIVYPAMPIKLWFFEMKKSLRAALLPLLLPDPVADSSFSFEQQKP